jgi:hypothetical protein
MIDVGGLKGDRIGHHRYNLFGRAQIIPRIPEREQDPLAHEVANVRAQRTCHVTLHVSAAPFFF